MHADQGSDRTDLVGILRAGLIAKLERVLRSPLIAQVVRPPPPPDDDLPLAFRILQGAAQTAAPRRSRANPWREDPDDGTFTVGITLDYDDLWRGREKEVVDTVSGTIEHDVVYLTAEQKLLLERSPREFLELRPRPESAELVHFRTQIIGGSQRVVELIVAAAPKSPDSIRHLAIAPNLVPLERQLAGLYTVRLASDDGPLAPLRALLGLLGGEDLPTPAAAAPRPLTGRLDEYQAACVRKALATPHFAVLQGPPGSGKTTVITSILRESLARGERALVVSPTHVAVDNVIEKLTPRPDDPDDLEVCSLPLRYAARASKLLPVAHEYWVGPRKQRRCVTIARRVEHRLCAAIPQAHALFARVDPRAAGFAPLSDAIDGVESIICGTPIGILSHDPVKTAPDGSFDLLIVDEVSKMTLPEFLAIAVKARRWVLVGDPEQLPPFNNTEENGVTLDDALSPALELVCSVGGILERLHPSLRREHRLVVVAAAPAGTAAAIRAHLAAVGLEGPLVSDLAGAHAPGIVVCTRDELTAAIAFLSPTRGHDRTHTPEQPGSLAILVERGLAVPRPAHASGARLVEPRMRAPALLFENAYAVYHAQPWSTRASQKLRLVGFRNGLTKYLPSLGLAPPDEQAALILDIALRFAAHTVSVYDWLTGIPISSFDVSPLQELGHIERTLAGLRAAVRPFVGTLRKQYRMHPSLSRVPRALFYFEEALHDGVAPKQSACRVQLVQVAAGRDRGEHNVGEADKIGEMLTQLDAASNLERSPHILVITPYRKQEQHILDKLDALRGQTGLTRVAVEVCTLDRCQGREAEYVFISLVHPQATTFLDVPKRWNVALTRAMQGLFIVGDIDAYLGEARKARKDPRTVATGRPLMSLLARILEAYDLQLHGLLAAPEAR